MSLGVFKASLTSQRGFTLIELIIVIVILTILIAMAIPSLSGLKKNALATAAEINVKTVVGALLTAEAGLRRQTINSRDSWSSATELENTSDVTLTSYDRSVGSALGSAFPGKVKWTISTTGTPIIEIVSWSSGGSSDVELAENAVTFNVVTQEYGYGSALW